MGPNGAFDHGPTVRKTLTVATNHHITVEIFIRDS
jgi:hypothetical protein